jgi:hypothetical protein
MNLHPSEETHRWPHSKTLRMTQGDIQAMEQWFDHNHVTHVHVSVRRRAYTNQGDAQTRKYAVVIHCRDLDAWPAVVLAWC